jgi:hypothetical protein
MTGQYFRPRMPLPNRRCRLAGQPVPGGVRVEEPGVQPGPVQSDPPGLNPWRPSSLPPGEGRPLFCSGFRLCALAVSFLAAFGPALTPPTFCPGGATWFLCPVWRIRLAASLGPTRSARLPCSDAHAHCRSAIVGTVRAAARSGLGPRFFPDPAKFLVPCSLDCFVARADLPGPPPRRCRQLRSPPGLAHVLLRFLPESCPAPSPPHRNSCQDYRPSPPHLHSDRISALPGFLSPVSALRGPSGLSRLHFPGVRVVFPPYRQKFGTSSATTMSAPELPRPLGRILPHSSDSSAY